MVDAINSLINNAGSSNTVSSSDAVNAVNAQMSSIAAQAGQVQDSTSSQSSSSGINPNLSLNQVLPTATPPSENTTAQALSSMNRAASSTTGYV
jgi:hypothetical protein